MGKCHTVQAILADCRSGVLSPAKQRWVEAHLAECPECARELRVLDEVLALVDANTTLQEPPAGLWNGVASRIAVPEARRSAFGHWLARPIRLVGVGAAALALMAAILLGGVRNDSVVPVRVASSNEYVQGHALYAGQAPLADRVGYLSLIAADQEQKK